ncbi:MAG: DUF917 family protein [Thermomicrobiales bacterium]
MTASPIRQLDLEAIQDLAVGSALLGTGGGGDPFIGRIITEQAIPGSSDRLRSLALMS